MPYENRFTVELEHLDGYQFRLKVDWPESPDLLLDEPAPLGSRQGPNAARLLAAAAANCLSASLLYCLTRADAPAGALRAAARGGLARNAAGRLRVERIDVRITLDGPLQGHPKLARCLALFEDYCVVTESLRRGFPVTVTVTDSAGRPLHPGP